MVCVGRIARSLILIDEVVVAIDRMLEGGSEWFESIWKTQACTTRFVLEAKRIAGNFKIMSRGHVVHYKGCKREVL